MKQNSILAASLAVTLALDVFCGVALAADPAPKSTPTPAAASPAPIHAAAPAAPPAAPRLATAAPSASGGWETRVNMIGAGPLMFNDVPDQRLSRTTVFEYGGGVTLTSGDELSRLNRIGGGISFLSVARSADRSLQFLTPYFAYQTGHPLALELEAGPAIAMGQGSWTKKYSGLSTAATLRYAFRRSESDGPVSVAAGLTGRFVASTGDFTRSTAFVGAQLEFAYHGGAR